MVKQRPANTIFNVPNQITSVRLVLAIIVFVVLPFELYLLSLVLFTIAAATDWIDGYWARKYDQVTRLGRILDPFVDKVIICGMYILLAADTNQRVFADAQIGIAGWMAVVVVARELLVTAIRSHIEKAGGDFSARWSGKIKMVVQCVAVFVTLLSLHLTRESEQVVVDLQPWLKSALAVSVWLSIVCTVYSGVGYLRAAVRILRDDGDDEATTAP